MSQSNDIDNIDDFLKKFGISSKEAKNTAAEPDASALGEIATLEFSAEELIQLLAMLTLAQTIIKAVIKSVAPPAEFLDVCELRQRCLDTLLEKFSYAAINKKLLEYESGGGIREVIEQITTTQLLAGLHVTRALADPNNSGLSKEQIKENTISELSTEIENAGIAEKAMFPVELLDKMKDKGIALSLVSELHIPEILSQIINVSGTAKNNTSQKAGKISTYLQQLLPPGQNMEIDDPEIALKEVLKAIKSVLPPGTDFTVLPLKDLPFDISSQLSQQNKKNESDDSTKTDNTKNNNPPKSNNTDREIDDFLSP